MTEQIAKKNVHNQRTAMFLAQKSKLFVEILVDLGPKDSRHASPAVTTNSHLEILESEEIHPGAW
jgi:hypothetical protein